MGLRKNHGLLYIVHAYIVEYEINKWGKKYEYHDDASFRKFK